MLKVGSLCTGYGGLDMAVEEYFDAETVWVSEIDKYASQLIELKIKKPNLGDLKLVDWASVEPIDILTAGYPCQPFSHAGQRQGTNDARHIWPYIKTAISVLRPSIVILENVRGHLSLGFSTVLGDLAEIGYDAQWTIVRASDVGAPHRRERLFIVAHPNGDAHAQSRRTIGSVSSQTSQEFNGSNRSIDGSSSEITSNSTTEFTDSDSIRRTLVGDISGKIGNQRQSQFIVGSLEQIAPNSNNARRFRNLSGLQSRFDTRIISHTNDQHQSHDGQMQELGRRFASRCEMSMQTAPDTLVDGKLNAEFVEYMMGLPPGWVTDCGLSRAQQLKILGNGVVPQQAHYALELLHHGQ